MTLDYILLEVSGKEARTSMDELTHRNRKKRHGEGSDDSNASYERL